ncbi:hypothetical protein LOTGIDRAFT_236468 [Lottia gigantea]|uniref:Uncharacterized protein n=1 Tax=Lottia gigantea TaxID=225164 RepID=V4B564_LOTGI|nr:hypothetical protein LOTGIDRAFT_236468 [Lottia gigantea]ESO83604.1 hypothetical protein LOTGIDRAFT_236468 [Lottia gigantea]
MEFILKIILCLLLIELTCLTTSLGVLDGASEHYSYKYILNADYLEGIVDEAAARETVIMALDEDQVVTGTLDASDNKIIIEISTSQYRKDYFKSLNRKLKEDNVDLPPEITSMNSSLNNSLPQEIQIQIVHTRAFKVSPDFSLRLTGDLGELERKATIQFYIMLVNTTSISIVSNPLPFLVYVKKTPRNNEEHGGAIYAGVILLIIMAISLLLPFTVRAKRRRRAGKPICGCGSAEGNEESSIEEIQQKSEPQVFDNPAMVFANGQQKVRRSSLATSHFHYGPKWLDPHYDTSATTYDPLNGTEKPKVNGSVSFSALPAVIEKP